MLEQPDAQPSVTFIIAYWGEFKDVYYASNGGEYGPDEWNTLFRRMETYVTEGHTTEILEVIHHKDDDDIWRFVINKTDQWREQLREQGYEIAGKDQDQ